MNKCLKIVSVLVVAAAMMQSAMASEVNEVRDALKKKFPATTVTAVYKTPIPGVYEVIAGKNVMFTGKDARHVIFGRMMDMDTQRDLTADRLAELNKIDFDALPLAKAIKVTSGNGKRAFAVFTDPDCPYCKSLEREGIKGITDYTMYVFPYPIASLHPDARRKAINIMCQKDKSAAWINYMHNSLQPENTECNNPVDEFIQLARALGVDGTPTLIRFDGTKTAGALPAARLDAWLNKQQ